MEKPELVVLNKIDLVPEEEREARIQRVAGAIGLKRGERPVVISGATQDGLHQLLESAWHLAEKGEVGTWRAGVEARERPAATEPTAAGEQGD